MTKIEIEEAVHFHTYGVHTMGFGLVAMFDKRKHNHWEGEPIFAHRVYENLKAGENPTDEQVAEIKSDCDRLVSLLAKFYHTSEFVEREQD